MTTIAAPHCDCSECRAKHWAVDGATSGGDLVTFTAHEVTDAYQLGWDAGFETGLRRIVGAITDWLKLDPDDPTQWLAEDDQ